ncbi:MAG: hypothetical protein PVJ40_06190 [Gammaproteobacteria bacterium]|jgi:hypothetical protein
MREKDLNPELYFDVDSADSVEETPLGLQTIPATQTGQRQRQSLFAVHLDDPSPVDEEALSDITDKARRWH